MQAIKKIFPKYCVVGVIECKYKICVYFQSFHMYVGMHVYAENTYICMYKRKKFYEFIYFVYT